MEEGGLCCWDLSEPDRLHQPQQQQQQQQRVEDKPQPEEQQQQQLLPARRPSYSTELPLIAGSSDTSWLTPEPKVRTNFSTAPSSTTNTGSTSSAAFDSGLGSIDSIVAIAVLQPTSSSRAAGSNAASQGGAACQLVSLSPAGNVAMFSVMLGAAAGRLAAESGVAAAAADLGTRAGEKLYCTLQAARMMTFFNSNSRPVCVCCCNKRSTAVEHIMVLTTYHAVLFCACPAIRQPRLFGEDAGGPATRADSCQAPAPAVHPHSCCTLQQRQQQQYAFISAGTAARAQPAAASGTQ
jgi:hypothetical protein